MNRITCLLLLKILLICSLNKKLTDAEDLTSAVSKTYQSHNIRNNLNLIRNWILNKNNEKTNLIEDSRTFGRIRRLQFMMLPIMFKLGVMSTLMLVLLALAIKGVIIGKILLLINFGIIVAKIVAAYTAFIAKSKIGLHNKSWNEHSEFNNQKDVHVHIHTNNPPYYSGYETNYLKNEKWPPHSREGWYPPSSNHDFRYNDYYNYKTINDHQPPIPN